MQDQFLNEAQQRHADLPLRFDAVLVIVGGGDVDATVLQALVAEGASVIAADGGADVCAALGITPLAIIGDMDSLNNRAEWQGRSRLIEIDEQETTDFEKCLYATEARTTVALGMTGKRLDHTLAALESAARYAGWRNVIFVDIEDIAIVCSGAVDLPLGLGARISIHPLGSVDFLWSTGLKYPLDGLTLAPGVRTGTSNLSVADLVSIRTVDADQAPYLVMLGKAHLAKVLAHLAD